MKHTLLYVFIFLVTNSIFSQTNVSGGLFSNTTWGISGSPYIVTSDVALFPGYTLTIEPGVTVKFDSGTKLILRGTLTAISTDGNEITFTSNESNPTLGSWEGIEVENNQGGKIIASYIKGAYADNFIRIMNSSAGEVLNVTNSEIENCNRVFYGYDGNSTHTVVLDNLHVHHNNYAFIYGQNVTITNSIFSDGEKGVHCWESPANMSITNSEFFNFTVWPFNMGGEIDNCHIHDNAVGIRMKPNLIVKNSTIEFNTVGVEANYPIQMSGANVFDNKICDNTQYNFKHLYSYPLTISNNCWCSSDGSEISQTIYDAFDDVSLGIVTFTPFDDMCESSLSVEESFADTSNISIYPNPASKEIFLSKNIQGNYKIYALNGVVVHEGIVTNSIPVAQLNAGVYIIKISNEDTNEYLIKKLIKN